MACKDTKMCNYVWGGDCQLLPAETGNYTFQNAFEEETQNNKDIKLNYFHLHSEVKDELIF